MRNPQGVVPIGAVKWPANQYGVLYTNGYIDWSFPFTKEMKAAIDEGETNMQELSYIIPER